jgi:hypothetical protein
VHGRVDVEMPGEAHSERQQIYEDWAISTPLSSYSAVKIRPEEDHYSSAIQRRRLYNSV